MSELPRLIDECESDFERAILSAGRQDDSHLRKAQVLAALGVGTALTLTSGSSAAATVGGGLAKAAQAVLAKKVLVASLVAGTGFVGVVTYQTSVSDPEPAPIPAANDVDESTSAKVRAVRRGVEVGTLPMAVPEQTPEQAFEEAADEVEAPAVVERVPGTTRSQRRQEAAPGLNDEVALLDRARAAISGGRPTEALLRLDEHAAKFPKGGLTLEAQVLRVQALSAAGRKEEASSRAKRILGRSPNSVVANRLRQYVIE